MKKPIKEFSRMTYSKLIPIGNSQGVRLPKILLQKYNLSKAIILEETSDGILIHNKKDKKLSWEETFKQAALEKENWDDFDRVITDGMDDKEF